MTTRLKIERRGYPTTYVEVQSWAYLKEGVVELRQIDPGVSKMLPESSRIKTIAVLFDVTAVYVLDDRWEPKLKTGKPEFANFVHGDGSVEEVIIPPA